MLAPRAAALGTIAACHLAAIAAFSGNSLTATTQAEAPPFVVELLSTPAARTQPEPSETPPAAVAGASQPPSVASRAPRPESRRIAAPAQTPPPVLPEPVPAFALETPAPVLPAPLPTVELALVPASESPKSEPTRTVAAYFDPTYRGNPRPDYPLAARRLGEQGTVMLSVDLDAEGGVRAIAVAQSSGSERLDRAAARAVAAWQFFPARQGELTVASAIEVPIVFRLED